VAKPPFVHINSEIIGANRRPFITNFMGHDLTIIVVQIFFFIGSYEIDINVIHQLILFEQRCCVHYLNMNVICLFVLFIHECCMSIHIVYIWKSCTWFPCLNNAWHSCVNDMNPLNNRFHMNLERNHETYKFVISLEINKVHKECAQTTIDSDQQMNQ
jgi:hypothetical protein